MTSMLYRVVSLEDFKAALEQGVVPRCGSDERDGFVHLSTSETLLGTANLYFVPAEAPLALEIDPEALGDGLVWEVVEARGGARFPHLYAPNIPMGAVCAAIRLEHDGQRFHLGRRRSPKDAMEEGEA